MERVYLVCADLHIREHEAGKRESFKRLVADLSCHEDLVIAGDFFDAFVGRPQVMLEWQREFLDVLKKAKGEGKRIIYVEGNRDFFVKNLVEEFFVEVHKEFCALADNLLVVVHGDLINRKDYWYRVWRAVVKNRVVFAVVNALIPGRQLIRLIFWLEKRMRKLNQRFKHSFPASEIDAFVSKIVPGPHLVVSGHFHVFAQRMIDKVTFISLPPWDEYPNILRITLDNDLFFYKLDSL